MVNRLRYILWGLSLLLTGVLILFLWIGMGNRKGMERVVLDADIKVNRVNLRELDGERVVWELTAKEGRYVRGEGTVFLKEVELIFYSRSGETYTLTAREGRYDERYGNVRLTGDVVGTSSDGYRVLTDSLLYRAREGLIETDDKVVVKGPDMVIEGVGLQIDIDRSLFTMKGRVRTSISARRL